jgi:ECF sigma factor
MPSAPADTSSAQIVAIPARFGSPPAPAAVQGVARMAVLLDGGIGVFTKQLRSMAPDPETDGSASVSQLLADWAAQDPGALDRLVPLVYDELRRLAHYHMRGERAGHTLQTTALVNEVYVRLTGIKGLQWRDRAHFFAMAGTLMRRVLVDYARRQRRDKRGAAFR